MRSTSNVPDLNQSVPNKALPQTIFSLYSKPDSRLELTLMSEHCVLCDSASLDVVLTLRKNGN